jgi:hypothetical protein
MPTGWQSISAQSSSAASSVSDYAARCSGRAMRSSCPIRRRAMPISVANTGSDQPMRGAFKHIHAQVSLHAEGKRAWLARQRLLEV